MATTFTDIDSVGKRYRFSTKLPIIGDEEGVLLTSYQAASEHTAARILEKLGKVNVFEICSGVGGTTVFLAKRMAHVYALDINPVRIEAAKINARTFDVLTKITYIQGDALDDKIIDQLRAKDIDAVVSDVEWREDLSRSLSETTPDIDKTIPNTSALYRKMTTALTRNLIMHMAANTDKQQLRQLGSCEIEEMTYQGRVKFINVYFGALINAVGVTRFDMDNSVDQTQLS